MFRQPQRHIGSGLACRWPLGTDGVRRPQKKRHIRFERRGELVRQPSRVSTAAERMPLLADMQARTAWLTACRDGLQEILSSK